MPRDYEKIEKTQIDEYRGGLLMRVIRKSVYFFIFCRNVSQIHQVSVTSKLGVD